MIKYLQLFILLSMFSCCSGSEVDEATTTKPKKNNPHIIASTILYTNWIPISNLASSSSVDLRFSLIDKLSALVKDTPAELDSLDDDNLSWSIILYKFLEDAKIKTTEQLLNTSLDDALKIIIAENARNTEKTESFFQSLDIKNNLHEAYEWWFRDSPKTKNIIENLNNITDSNPIYNLRDNKNNGMDVLRIIKADEEYKYLGVYHQLQSNTSNFKLYLAGSNDLEDWIQITELGERSHQGDIEKWNNGYIVANEQDIEHGSNNIRVRYYKSYSDLVINNAKNDLTIERKFAPTAEGTPDIRKITGNTPEDSHIVIGFHYYENITKDQLAFGVLKNFSEWSAWKDVISNYNINKMGYKGNIGGRKTFDYYGINFIQEAQITSNDWGGWRLLYGNGAFYYTLNPSTELHSTSFANPGVAKMGDNEFVVTSYMHSDGNHKDERQELLYKVKF